MSRIRSGLGIATAASLVTLVLVSTTAAPILLHISRSIDGRDGMTAVFDWQAPSDLNGTFVGSLVLEPDAPTDCDIQTAATGRNDHDNPVVFWSRATSDGGTSGSIGKWHRLGHAHAGRDVDTREVDRGEGWWRMGGSIGSSVENRLIYTVATFGLQRSPDDPADASPLSVNVTCQGPVEIVSRHASRRGRSFDQENMEGGIGASVRFPIETKISRNDRLVESFGTDEVRFQASIYDWDEDTQGNLSLRYPNETRTWSIPHRGTPSIEVDGPPGRYAVGLNWTSMQSHDQVFGILVGLERVDSWSTVV